MLFTPKFTEKRALKGISQSLPALASSSPAFREELQRTESCQVHTLAAQLAGLLGEGKMNKEILFAKIPVSGLLHRRKVKELIRLYTDVEKTLRGLQKNYLQRTTDSVLPRINVRKLVVQLAHSKKRIERKLGNTLLLEKQILRRKLKSLKANLRVSSTRHNTQEPN